MESKLFLIILLASSVACQNAIEEIFEEFQHSEPIIPANACSMFINNQTGYPEPLYLQPGTEKFLHPNNRNRILTLTANQEVEMYCAEFSTPSGAQGLIKVNCVSGSTVRYGSTNYDFANIACKSGPLAIAKRRTSGTTKCYNNGIFVDVGFSLPDGRFVKTYTVCHDPILERIHYSYYILEPHTDGNQQGLTRPSFRQEDFFPGKDINYLQTTNVQRQTLATILGSSDQAYKFIPDPPGNYFMSRGHIAAMTDFVYATEQFATFFYINTAPQWQGFNSLNWQSVEDGTRKLAADRGITLDTYTGTFGVTQLWNEAGTRFDLHLYHNQSTGGRGFPVPMIFYRIIVNKAANSGAVFLGVNNPYLTLADINNLGYIVCDDVSDRITYISWQKDNISRGYSYVCEVNDFLRRVPHISGLSVSYLLV
jgi:DNA/RNA non-specific endonuclease